MPKLNRRRRSVHADWSKRLQDSHRALRILKLLVELIGSIGTMFR